MMRSFWCQSRFVMHWFPLLMIGFVVWGTNTVERWDFAGNAVVAKAVSCQVGGNSVTDNRVSVDLTCGDIHTATNNAHYIAAMLTNHLTTMTCNIYQDHSVGQCGD